MAAEYSTNPFLSIAAMKAGYSSHRVSYLGKPLKLLKESDEES